MAGRIKYPTLFLFVIALLLEMHSAAYCMSGRDPERYFAIHGDYIYVLPDDPAAIQKIDKRSGHIQWRLGKWFSDDEYPPGDNYTRPVFSEGNFYTITDIFRLVGFDCNTGRVVFDYMHSAVCSPGLGEFAAIIYDDLVLVIASQGVQAIDLKKKAVKWEFTCKKDLIVYIYGYFQIEDSLFIFADVPVEGASSAKAESDKAFRRNALIELNCSTGEVLNHYDASLFWGDTRDSSIVLGRHLGDWQGKPLLFVSSILEVEPINSSLFIFDPKSRSAKMVIEELRDVDSTREVGPGPVPFLWQDMVFYSLSDDDDENITMVARSLADGKIYWTSSSRAQEASGESGRMEVPYVAGEGKLFSLEYLARLKIPHTTGEGKHLPGKYNISINVVCRNASTGKICWKSKINVVEGLSLSEVDMQVSEGSLFMQTDEYMRAFDLKNGKLLWEVSLTQCQRKDPENMSNHKKSNGSEENSISREISDE